MVLSIGLMLVGGRETVAARRPFDPSLPVGLAVATTTLILWQALIADQRDQVQQTAQAVAEGVRAQLGDALDSRLRGLERMAFRWERRGGTPYDEWIEDASAYAAHEKSAQAVAWIEPGLRIRWIVPTGGNTGVEEANFGADPALSSALAGARDRNEPLITGATTLPQGGRGFIAFYPLYPRSEFAGFIVGMFRFEPLLEQVMAESGHVGYAIGIFDGGDRLYGSVHDTRTTSFLRGTAILPFHSHKWRVVLEPTDAELVRTTNTLPHFVLALGLGFAGVLTFAVRSARQARTQAASLEKTNADFRQEIATRAQTEVRLRESEEQFRQSFDFAGIGMALVGLEGQWRRVNRSLCELLGYGEAELRGKTFRDITHPEDRDKGLADERALLAGEHTHYQNEKRCVRSDGELVWIRLTASLVRTAAGQPLHFVAQIENITERHAAKMALEKTAARLKLATEAASLAVWDWNVVTNEIAWDAGMFRLYGVASTPDGQVAYETWRSAVLPEDIQAQEQSLHETLAARGRGQREFRIRRRNDGSLRVISAAEIVLADYRGKPAHVVGINMDVTERRNAEAAIRESEEKFRSLAESAPIGIFQTDPAGRYTYTNPKWQQLAGLEGTAAGGEGWSRAVHPEDAARVSAAWNEAARAGREFSHTFRFAHADGSHRWVHARAAAVHDAQGHIAGYVGSNEDITGLKQLQLLVEQRNAALEIETRRALEANRLKSEFLAHMSHELRTPLNGIIGFSTFLAGEKAGPLNPQQKGFLKDVLNSGRHLLRLINDLLDLAKIEAGKLELAAESFSLRTAIAEVTGVLRPLIADKKLEFRDTFALADERVILDAGKIKQVLYNLLSNAIKFTAEGGSIALHTAAEGDDWLVITVRDSGIGIKEEDLGRLFVEFQQLDSSAARRFQGTGLGLALAKKFVVLHGGTIHVASEFGRGTTFTVVLPRQVAVTP